MTEPTPKAAITPVPAATILLVRDAPNGIEVFMVKRHHQIDFVAGALVFPGGKAQRSDFDSELAEYSDGVSVWSGEMRALGAAAIREAFEESGILMARDGATGAFVGEERLAKLSPYRHKLEKAEISLLDMLRAENLKIACDELAHFAHWITPENMPKRFNTHFFLASSPVGHAGSHDGRESVDSVWIRPEDAIASREKLNVIFPTKLNLMKLARSKTVAEALKAARAAPPLTVTPWVEPGPNGNILRIRDDAGYEQISASLRDAN
ncbi:MAG: NUDIX domain-containing protein [Rhizomicrobium sp.]|jgi:8-oxo-dGTP pyrophosphatase MutT (NUDIX family)